ncbi:MAG: TIGR03808 family TAT-translocated repetitive protein [Bauldia sp.]|nr:TIGR03808 family TAT-translocated repetitive protein [Bauldia sp.]
MDRRAFLSGAFGIAALTPQDAGATGGPATFDEPPALRGSIDANARGLRPDAPDDQSRLLQALLQEAAAENRPLFLPPGRYVVSQIVLPARTRLAGVAGATELAYGGGGHLLATENAEVVELRGLVLDGGGLPLADYVPGLVHLASTRRVAIGNCEIRGSAKAGLALDRTAGHVEHTTVKGAGNVGIRAIESTGLSITSNLIADCRNGGILVWRWTEGDDGTLVTGNRIERIAAANGGDGDGISVFRAHSVMVAGNRVTGCASAAVRARSADMILITGNACSGAGEAGIVIESGFAGALVTNNIVDRCPAGISVGGGEHDRTVAVVANNMVRDQSGPAKVARNSE